MAATGTLTGDLATLIGGVLPGTVRARLVTNLPAGSAVIDQTRNLVMLGSQPITVGADGTFSLAGVMLTNATDLNVAADTLQYQVVADYVDAGDGQRKTWTSGWFFFTASADVADLAATAVPAAAVVTSDSVVAGLVNSPTSATSGALSATIATRDVASTPGAHTYAQTFKVDGITRVRFGAQRPDGDQNASAGMVEIVSGAASDANPRVMQLTHYQYGFTMRQSGNSSSAAHQIELFLGSDAGSPGPNFSVRHYGSNKGAIIQARDATDESGVCLEYTDSERPKVAVEYNSARTAGQVLAIEQPNPGGKIAFATKTGAAALSDKWTITNAGDLEGLAGATIKAQQLAAVGGDWYIKDVTGTTQLRIGSPGLGFFGQAPVGRQTGVAVTAAGIHAALVTLGLISA